MKSKPIKLECKGTSYEEYEMQQDIIKRINYENPALKYFNTNYEYSLIDIKLIDDVYHFKLLLKNENIEYIRTFIGKTPRDTRRLFLKFKGKELLINSLAIIGGIGTIFDIAFDIVKSLFIL